MKAGNNGIETDTVVVMNSSISKKGGDRSIKNSILISVLPILAMIIAMIASFVKKANGLEIAKLAILTLLLSAIATFYIRMNASSVLNKKLAKAVITLGYLGSIVLLFFIPEPDLFCFWMLGGLFISMVIDNKLGILLHFNLSFIMGITLSPPPETVIQLLIIGVLMCLLSGALRSKSTVIYAIIIILSTNITLSFVIHNFIFDPKENYNYLNSLFSILAVLVTAFLLCIFYELLEKRTKQPDHLEEMKSEKELSFSDFTVNTLDAVTVESPPIKSDNLAAQSDSSVNKSDIPTVQADHFLAQSESILEDKNIVVEVPEAYQVEGATLPCVVGTRTSYDVLCSFDNELLKRLNTHSESLYSHALHIADLSYRAALLLGANERIAQAGGLYHEIGKINGKNYIEEGLQIAQEYAFPKELIAILKEHNIKYDKPNSVEATIVMLSDNVVSTIEYLEKADEHKFSINKIIDNIFQMRMEKGTFDLVNLSLKDFKLLKEFFQKEFNETMREKP